MMRFKEFIDKKERLARKHLKIVKKLLESQGFKVGQHLDTDDSYIYVYAPEKDVSFDGIRIYKIGDQIAFRVQKNEKTHPFGEAYPLDIEGMFQDLMSDHHKPEDAGRQVIKAVIDEVHRFFKKTAEAEKYLRSQDLNRNNTAFDPIVIKGTGTDYSNLTYNATY